MNALKEAMKHAPGPAKSVRGKISYRDVMADYLPKVLEFAGNHGAIRDLNVVVDPSNGVGGKVFCQLAAEMQCALTEINARADGEFPAHAPNPLKDGSMDALKEKVKKVGADVGVIFDGDADRAILVDERGETVSGSQTLALLAESFLEENPGARVVYNLVTSRAVPDVVRRKGGIPYICPVGHSQKNE